MKTDNSHYTKTDLKRRGWNDQLIEQFLKLPDKYKINMKHKSGPRICLYEARRVEEAESTKEFIELQQKRQKRRQAAQRGTATKKEQMRQELENIIFRVPRLGWRKLTRLAVEHYNARQQGQDENGPLLASMDADNGFLNRIRVNYLRHQLTDYDNRVRSPKGKVGAMDARLDIKEKVLDAISQAYPELSAECIRQAGMAFDHYLITRASQGPKGFIGGAAGSSCK